MVAERLGKVSSCRDPVLRITSPELLVISDHSLTLDLTPQAFAELKDGAEVIAFYNPDLSGAFAKGTCCFGRLNKSMLNR